MAAALKVWLGIVVLLAFTGCDPVAEPTPTTTAVPAIPPSATFSPIMPTVNNPDTSNIDADKFTPGAPPLSTNNPAVTISPIPVSTEASFDMQFVAGDGLVLAGTYYAAARRPATGVLLLHMEGGKKEDWQSFAIQLQAAGYNVLAIDLRGHGFTGGQVDWSKTPGDVTTVFKQFRSVPGVSANGIFIIGAGIGANLAVNVCADQKDCKAAILLSPGLNYSGIETSDAMRRYAPRPILLVAARDDVPAGKDSATLDKSAKGDHKLQLYNGTSHGTALFKANPDLAPLLIQWLASHGALS